MIPPFPASALRLHPFAPSVALTLALHAACLSGVRAQESGAVSTSPAVEVIGVMPLPGFALPLSQIAAPAQTAGSRELGQHSGRSIADFLQGQFNGVYANEMQGNPFQPDLSYRGFTASPLLGTPQGLSVYLDGVRINQPFGDVVSWDLIPRRALESVTLMPGSNPVFGLNTLGGALVLKTKDGLGHAGTGVHLVAGSQRRGTLEFEHGGSNRDGADWYVTGTLHGDHGWRQGSPSDVAQLFGKLGWGTGPTRIKLSYAYANTRLTGNGLQEQRLLENDYASVYTRSDTTLNRAGFLNLEATHEVSDTLSLAGNVYYRRIDTRTRNDDLNEGSLDQSVYQPNAAERAALTAAGYSGFPLAGESARNTPFPFWRCIANVLLRDEPGEKCNALINRSHTMQQNYGAAGQATFSGMFGGRQHKLTAGAALDLSRMQFGQSTQLAYLNPDRSVTALDAYADGVTGGNVDGTPFDNRVDLGARTQSISGYVADVMPLGEAWHLSASGRYQTTSLRNRDQINPGGGARSLDGDHRFSRFNPAIGVTYAPDAATSGWAGINQGSRVPTAIELGCANPLQPCRLPNAMAGDPPLKQVITRTVELGARGNLSGSVRWTASVFRAENHDDILFVAAPNRTQFGFFRNVGLTRREGAEVALRGRVGRIEAGLQYSLVNATFRTEETLNGTANSSNDTATSGAGAGLDGNIRVRPGDRIPLVPRHQMKLHADWRATERLGMGGQFVAVGSAYARGNENNQHQPDGSVYPGAGKSPGYALVNLNAQYQVDAALRFIGQVSNVFDRRYATAAQLGPMGFTAGGNFIARALPAVGGNFPVPQGTFHAPGAPRTLWLGVSYLFDAVQR